MCATDIGNSILLKVYTRHHLLNIKAHRILYSFYRRTSQAQTWWAPRINNFNQLEKKKKRDSFADDNFFYFKEPLPQEQTGR